MSNKSKVVSALLAFFLGTTGTHRYYLGYKKQGIIQTCGFISLVIGYAMYIPAMMDGSTGMLLFSALFLLYGAGIGIWAFVDFIRILTGGLTPADGSAYTENRPAQVQVIQTAPSSNVHVDALEKLAKLHDQGILTDDEFQQKKTELLAKIRFLFPAFHSLGGGIFLSSTRQKRPFQLLIPTEMAGKRWRDTLGGGTALTGFLRVAILISGTFEKAPLHLRWLLSAPIRH